jgi:tetratricopeptide (TPR) repeat protein
MGFLAAVSGLLTWDLGCTQDVASRQRIRDLENKTSDTRSVFGSINELLAAGADAIRYGRYDEGINLTLLGLERRDTSDRNRAAALSNLCAAFAAKNSPDEAIIYCTQSLEISELNWQAWSNRSYAYWLKTMYEEAASDLDRAIAIDDGARQLSQIRGMLNEAGLRPRIITEDRQ